MKINSALSMCIVLAVAITMHPPQSQAINAIDTPDIKLPHGQNIGFSVRGSAGMLNGESRELVYDFDLGYRRKTSELIWDLKNLYMVGVIGSANIADIINLNLGIWSAVNQGSGGMIDYDWILNTPGAPSLDDWTHRSISDVMVTTATIFDINGSLYLTKFHNFALRAIVGFKQDSWKWDDKAYDYVYSQGGFRNRIGTFGGENVIDYEEVFSMPYIGASANGPLGPVDVGAYLLFSTAVSAEDKDFHILRGIHFKETFSGGTYLGLGLNATYRISDKWFITGEFEYQSIPEISGDMEITNASGTTGAASDVAGISHSSTMLSASVGYIF